MPNVSEDVTTEADTCAKVCKHVASASKSADFCNKCHMKKKNRTNIPDLCKTYILNLYKTVELEKCRKRPFVSYEKVSLRVSKALKIPHSTVKTIVNKSKSENLNIQSNVGKKKGRKSKYDEFDESLIRRTIHEFYRQNKFVSLSVLESALKDRGISIPKTTLSSKLKKLGFKHYKRNGRRFIKEQNEILASRNFYLRKIRKYRQEGREIVYLDETWINVNHACEGVWSENKKGILSALAPSCTECGRNIPAGKGERFIVLDAGSANQGFIPNVGLLFKSKTNSSDYHDEMNSDHFLEWFEKTLIPNLNPRSVIVMDNAPYHNILTKETKPVTNAMKKDEIIKWMNERKIAFEPESTKPEILQIAKQHTPPKKYVSDEIAAKYGHVVLRLPVKHCELNPIEIIQAEEKNYVARKNQTFKAKDIKELFLEAKGAISQTKYNNTCTKFTKTQQ